VAVHSGINIANLLPATLTAPGLTEEQFLALRREFPDCSLEYTEEGTVVIMPPTDPESSERVADVVGQLWKWAREQGSGHVVGPDGGFFLRSGSRRSPDAAWFDDRRWEEAKTPGLVFPVFAPEFVIEVRSYHDRLRNLRDKMEDYIANGVRLGWLIDPLEGTVSIYRPDQTPEVLSHPASVAGEGPVAGFVLDLARILPA
jgi:Uma2 family endonuclease